MILNPSENPALNESAAENDKRIEEISEVVRAGLDSLQRKWEQVPDRDDEFLSEAEKAFMKRHSDKSTAGEGTPEAINEYFGHKRKDLHELDSSRHGGMVSKISGDSIAECKYVFLHKVVNSPSPEEVSNYATALLERVSKILSDAFYNREEVRKIRNAITGKSYNMFGYDNQRTTENLESFSIRENADDEKFLTGFQDAAHYVKEAVNALASVRLQQLQKLEQTGQKIETLA
ncbi:MAG: hypothetical protein ABIJ82_04120 [Patescibacteria group bacterium]|nr:hypothetical protein [Patescibacteria group bacterium]MBU1952638.1 hypothetical protein [Patescibacteria group bacterium]